MIPWHDTAFYTPAAWGSDVSKSVWTAVAVGLVGLPAMWVTAIARWRDAVLHAREAVLAEAGAETRALRPGKTVLRGRVLGDRDADPPVVQVSIRQHGREYQTKQGQRHKWTEIDREVVTRPFTLRLVSGQEVRVEPDPSTFLVDHLYVVTSRKADWRTRVARVLAGEDVYVEGTLDAPRGGAYRGAAEPTLRPIRGGRMLISVEPLEKRHELRSRVHRTWAIVLLALLLLVDVGVFGSYWHARMSGKVESVPVLDLREWTTHADRGTESHYGIVVPSGPGSTEVVETSHSAYVEIEQARTLGQEARVPFFTVAGK
jgi:hypothetical protein